MKRSLWMGLTICIMAVCCRPDPMTDARPTGQTGQTSFVAASKSTPGDVDRLDQRKADLDRILNFYNYSRTTVPWDFKELKSPAVHKDAIFRFESVDPSGAISVFVAIVPPAPDEIQIVPLWDHGLRPNANVDLDPHNIAIFNAVVSREHPSLLTEANRLNLAILYLHFFEERPTILDQ